MSADKIERFTAGEAFAVNPDAVERELASLWREAGQRTETAAPVTRACLLNVIVLLEEREGREGYGSADTLQRWVDELPRHVAARSLIIRSQPNPDGRTELSSYISANCIIADGGGKLVCSEEVTIAAAGGADHHLPGLARALLVPGLPTSVVFGGVPRGALVDPMLRLADRVVTNADASETGEPLGALRRLMDDGRHSAMDLGWVGTAALRAEIASVFDPPFDEQALQSIDRIQCTTRPLEQWSSRLLLGWLARALGAEGPATAAVDGQAWSLSRPRGEPLTLELMVNSEADGPSFTFLSSAMPTPVTVQCIGHHVEAAGPHLPTVTRPRLEISGPEALARALIHRSEDGAFRRALKIAEELL